MSLVKSIVGVVFLAQALFTAGCAEQNLALKQRLLDQDQQISSLEKEIKQIQEVHDDNLRQAEELQRKTAAAQAEQRVVAEAAAEQTKNLQNLQAQIAEREAAGPGWDMLHLENGQEIPCLITHMENASMHYTSSTGERASQPMTAIRSIEFRNIPVP